MKTVIIPIVLMFSFSVMAQLEKPLLEGSCYSRTEQIGVKLLNGEFQVSLPKKTEKKRCIYKISDTSTMEGQVMPKETFHLLSEKCDGVFSVEPFIEVTAKGKYGDGIFTVLSDGDAISCTYQINDWKAIRDLSKKKRKI